MRVLVTGVAGFIGSHVAGNLLERGDTVVGVDNFCDYYDPQIKKRNIRELESNERFTLYQEDVEDYLHIKLIFEEEKPDKVVHLAARAGVRASIEDPLTYSHVNNIGTSTLLEMSRVFDVQNFVFASSSSVYGNNTKVPFSEKDSVDFPISPYAATKKAGELLCHVYSHLHNLPCTCLRFFTVYGPKGRPDMAPYKFVKVVSEGTELTKFGDGTTSRDYTYIDDIVDGVVSAVDANLQYEIINLGNSQTVTLNQFIDVVERLIDKQAHIVQMPIPPGDVERTYADISRAKELLGYNPITKFEDGMEKFVEWYLEERV
ncbi:GDP-mannose 4,6-dehydratase [Patescibacteria group bacterium]|nr:GDP-mannose 4,6-dehydratase [Patescibacteria group bacterium]